MTTGQRVLRRPARSRPVVSGIERYPDTAARPGAAPGPAGHDVTFGAKWPGIFGAIWRLCPGGMRYAVLSNRAATAGSRQAASRRRARLGKNCQVAMLE
jgi:hypothetical protein